MKEALPGSKIKLSVYVSTDVHRKAKLYAYDNGTTIQNITEDALERFFDPTQSTAHNLKPKEMTVVQTQLKQVLESGDEMAITSSLASIRGALELIRTKAKVNEIHQAPGEPSANTRSEQKQTDGIGRIALKKKSA